MLQKSTRPANPGDNRKWFIVDAKDQVLGRLAVVIANKLRAMGYEKVELIDTTNGMFMSPWEAKWMALSGSALLVGKK